MTKTSLLRSILAALAVLLVCVVSVLVASPKHEGPLVLAAASMQESLTAAADAWAAKGHPRPRISFAASSALARQIEAGAPADVFISADEAWMNTLQAGNLLRPGTRSSFLTNRLVLAAPAPSNTRIAIARGAAFERALLRALGTQRLAMADPAGVPAGRYGKQALERLGVWDRVQARVVPAANVRDALAYVSRGETPLGIVYSTDARADPRVRVAGVFPRSSHAPIRYPVAILAASRNREAEKFRRFLLSREGQAIFARYGFGTR
jgi:molybdate transport system substrate-binding protein